MVDFNKDATVATPAADILRILILQRRNDFIESKEAYRKANLSHGIDEVHVARARLESFWDEIEAIYYRDNGETKWQKFLEQVKDADTFEKIEDVFHDLNHWLDTKRLIRIDTKRQYDTTSVATEDEENGL